MRHRGLLIAALALVVVGLIGLTLAAVVFFLTDASSKMGTPSDGGEWPSEPRGSDYSSNGERIYYTGVGRDGPIPREWSAPGRMRDRGRQRAMGPACVSCHRPDGEGGPLGMMGSWTDAPDIRYETLTAQHEEGGKRSAGWTDEQIATAIRDGVEPSGERLDAVMPHWKMGEADMADLIDYLKEL